MSQNSNYKRNSCSNISREGKNKMQIFMPNSNLQKSVDLQKQRYLRTSRSCRQKYVKQTEQPRPHTALQEKTRQWRKKTNSTQNITASKQKITNDIQKLGLQNFMKEIITKEASSNQDLSHKIIFALNKTYLSNNIEPATTPLLVKIGPKSAKIKTYRSADQSPDIFSQSFELAKKSPQTGYMINQIFPTRKAYTKLLKAKQYGVFNAKKIESTTHISYQLKQSKDKAFEQYLKKTAQKMINSSSKNFRPAHKSRENLSKKINFQNKSMNESGVKASKAIIHY